MNADGPLRILVVEDHHDSRVMLERLLRSSGHEALLAGSVATALAVARSTTFDMVISDIDLPDGDGCALMQTLREMTGAAGIAVSGHVGEEHQRRAKAAGVCVHLCKPITFGKLLDAIEECRSEHTPA
ncbi:MAG TPA: response regulator [Tepidisphaeraceae bacterium]|nr:response regulator [Tepidisphaeraceae bacterium]